jgi:hypothetical protein
MANPVDIVARQSTPTPPNSTFITWIAGSCNEGFAVPGAAPITSGECFQILGDAYGFQQLPNYNCTVITYDALQCDSIVPGTPTQIPAGNEHTCVYGGVLDGGAHTHKSGKYLCDF